MNETVAIQVTPKSLDVFALMAEGTVQAVAEKFGEGSNGGYLFFCDSAGRQLLHKRLGDPNLEKQAKYHQFSQEKAERLLLNPDHLLSWQSRDLDDNRYGGAVRLSSGHVISFSGFPESVDEVFCISIARMMNWMSEAEIVERLKISNNFANFKDVYYLVAKTVISNR